MLHLERDEPRHRDRRALVPRAGRLPEHAVHGACRGDARIDERGVADRQSSSRSPRLRPVARSQGRDSSGQAAAPGCDGLAARAGAARTSRPSLGSGKDVQVVTGMPDLHTAALGTGAVEEGMAHTSISTTSWISLPVARKKTDAFHSIATIPGLDAHGYLVANNQEAAGLCLTWLRDALPGVESLGFDELLELAASAAPGSGTVIFTPWIAGERSPVDDRNARGGWHNVSVHTTGSELVRAVLEGVAYNSRWLQHAVERFAHRRLDPLRIFGGGAQSDLWCQIYADVLDRHDRARRVPAARQPARRDAARGGRRSVPCSEARSHSSFPWIVRSRPTRDIVRSTIGCTPSSPASTRPSAGCSHGSPGSRDPPPEDRCNVTPRGEFASTTGEGIEPSKPGAARPCQF